MPIQCTCSYCGAAFTAKPSRATANYCRSTCYHAARRIRSEATLLSRLWAKVNRDGPIPAARPDLGPCWIWTGALSHGYGHIGLNSVVLPTHRVTWESVNGPVPDGLDLDHLCRIRSCARPSHLEAVTPGENMRRGEAPTMIVFRSGACGRGHPRTPENVHWAVWRGKRSRRCRVCDRENKRGQYVSKPSVVVRGEDKKNARLTEEGIRVIRQASAEGITGAALARTYGVTKGAIYAILKRRAWIHVN